MYGLLRRTCVSIVTPRDRAYEVVVRSAMVLASLFAMGCGNGSDTSGAGGDAGTTTTLHPHASPLQGESECTVVEVTDIPETALHVPECTPVQYGTNPPSGGDHWPIWAAFKKYTSPVPREMYVHDLEHGAIVLTYRCANDCPDVVAALTSVFDGMADPLCLTIPGGPSARMVLTPDPDLPTPLAASAWGATYTATCIDTQSLQAFADAHYGNGPEQLCNDGVDVSTSPPCTDAGP